MMGVPFPKFLKILPSRRCPISVLELLPRPPSKIAPKNYYALPVRDLKTFLEISLKGD